MAPPPATPAQPRFLLSKRQVTTSQGEKQTPAQKHNGPQQFSSTPRFSVSSTPRQHTNQPPPFSTPAPSAAKYRQFRGHAAGDIIDSSPQSSDLVHDEDDEEETHGLQDSIEVNSPGPPSWLQSEGGERSPKRRRISTSPELDISSQPIEQADDNSEVKREDDLNVPEENSYSPLNSQESPSKSSSSSQEPVSRVQSNFQRAPRFKAADVSETALQHQLPDAFSPQRRGAKYVADGLAAEVRDWLVQIKGGTDYDRPGGLKVRLLVVDVKSAPGMWLIAARRVRDHHIDETATTVHAILAGKGRIAGLNSPSMVTQGSVIEISQPAWDVLLQHQKRWAVACDWEVVETEVPLQLTSNNISKIAA